MSLLASYESNIIINCKQGALKMLTVCEFNATNAELMKTLCSLLYLNEADDTTAYFEKIKSYVADKQMIAQQNAMFWTLMHSFVEHMKWSAYTF